MDRILAVLLLSSLLTGCVTGEPFRTRDTRLNNGKEYRLEVSGEYKRPEGKGPFPAVIILQSCGGTTSALYGWADELNSWGYATFLVKSLEARGMRVCQHPFSRTMMNMDVASDAYGALEHLSKKPEIDPKKIAVIGFSLGAGAINDWIINEREAPGKVDFAGAISFYQRCDREMNALRRYPVMQVTASLDHVHHPTCANYKKVMDRTSMAKYFDQLTVVTYEGVHHSFDDSRMYSMKADIGGNTMLYDYKAHQDSVVRVKQFLKDVFSR